MQDSSQTYDRQRSCYLRWDDRCSSAPARKGHPQSAPVYRDAVEHYEEEESHTSAVTGTDASNMKSRSYQTPDSAVELVRTATDACKGEEFKLELEYEKLSGCPEPPSAT